MTFTCWCHHIVCSADLYSSPNIWSLKKYLCLSQISDSKSWFSSMQQVKLLLAVALQLLIAMSLAPPAATVCTEITTVAAYKNSDPSTTKILIMCVGIHR